MSEEPIYNQEEITSDDKLWAALAYVFAPLIPIIILLMDDKKDRAFVKAHNAQALAIGLINIVVGTALGLTVVLACVPLLIWIAQLYWAYKAYQGEYVEIPLITNFVKNQGWA